MQSCHSLVVLLIDPGFELVLERRIVAVVFEVLPREGLEMKHVDLHLGKFVFVGCEVEKR